MYKYRAISEETVFNEEKIDLAKEIEMTLQFILKKYPSVKKIYGVGHSYGANQLMLYLGNAGHNSLINGAVSVSNPYCLMICSRHVKHYLFGLYDRILSGFLKNTLIKNEKIFLEGTK